MNSTRTISELTEEAKKYIHDKFGFPRAIAAEILLAVAEAGESGNTVEGLDPFIIGVAVSRIVSNYEPVGGASNWTESFLHGLLFRSGPRSPYGQEPPVQS